MYLDSRGMLHLKSSDPRAPEVSLVLTKGSIAGWSSSGDYYGLRKFIGDAAPNPLKFSAALAGFLGKLRTQ